MKRRAVLLFTLYGCAVIGLCVREFMSNQRALETLVPYSHPYVSETMAESELLLTESEQPLTETSFLVYSEAVTEEAVTETMVTETIAEADPTEPLPQVTYPLHLNTASFAELCTLPGIGKVTAQAICDYRDAIGGFRHMQQLLEVYGIGEEKYKVIVPYLWLEEEIIVTEAPEPEPPPPEVIPETEPPEIPIINLNTATKDILMLLPGCTTEIADNIIYLRDVQIHIICNPLEITMAEGVTDELYLMWEAYLAVDDEGSTQLYLD